MKCQILLAGKKNRKISSNILSAEIAQRVVKVRGTSLSNFLFKNDTFNFLLNETHKTRQSVWSIL